jgi:hypothetical protein
VFFATPPKTTPYLVVFAVVVEAADMLFVIVLTGCELALVAPVTSAAMAVVLTSREAGLMRASDCQSATFAD